MCIYIQAVLWGHVTVAKDLAAGVLAVPAPWEGCATRVPDIRFGLVAYILDFMLSLVFLVMTLRKLVESHRDNHGKLSLRSFRDMESMSPLLVAFVRDGTIFCSVNCYYLPQDDGGICCGRNARTRVLSICTNSRYTNRGAHHHFSWLFALDSYTGAHLILNLRAAGLRRNGDSTWNETLSIQYNDLIFGDD